MALTFPRWLAAALVGCAALLVVVTRDAATPRDSTFWSTPGEDLGRTRATARNRFGAAVDELRLAQIRDSLAARVDAADSVAAGTVRIDPALAAPVRELFATAIARESRAGMRALVPVDIAVVLDTGGMAVSGFEPSIAQAMLDSRRIRHLAISTHYVLPTAGAAPRCLALVRIGSPVVTGLEYLRQNLERVGSIRGPCAFFEAFGMPGPGVDRWLRMRGWALADHTPWDGTTPTFPLPTALVTRVFRAPPNGLGIEGVRCGAGDLPTCERVVLEPLSRGWAAPTNGVVSLDWNPSGELGRLLERHVLSEMVRTLGPDRFRRFWQSTASPGVAFQTAAGVSVGQWTHDLVIRAYGKQDLGPGVETAGLGTGIVIVLLGGAIGIAAARRRVIG